jgi:hypothetical protein
MRTIKEIKDYLKETEALLKEDEEKDFDDTLPCCDYRELEITRDILIWILNGK